MFRFPLSLLCGLLLVATSFRLSEQTQSGVNCPSGWQYFQGSCYAFGQSLETWSGAQATCTSLGGKLAEIATAEENNFLQNLARSKLAIVTWLGGTDNVGEGHWVWASDRRSIGPFTDWGFLQPDNFLGLQHCLTLAWFFGYKWDDFICTGLANYICETRPRCGHCN